MVALSLILHGDLAFPELKDKPVIHLGNDAPPIVIAGLEHGTESGAPSIVMRLDLPDGQTVLAETTLKLFLTAADALRTRFGDPR
jgi:hypothetical protein